MNTTERRESETPSAGSPPTGAPPLLYVVDDDVATVDLLCDVASEAGWSSIGFLRLAGLRAALDEEVPDLMILADELPVIFLVEIAYSHLFNKRVHGLITNGISMYSNWDSVWVE